MPDIFLLLPDKALCEAVAEQISAAKIGVPQRVGTALDLLKTREAGPLGVVILENVSSGKPNETLIQRLNEGDTKPIILVIGSVDETDVVTESFAKPLRLGHLITRLRFYLETAPLLREKPISFGPYRLDPQNRRILTKMSAEPIRLTEKETALLVFLAHKNEPATRRDILASVWGYDERIDTHTLETHIYQLRRKLDSESSGGENWLINESGAYRLARGPE